MGRNARTAAAAVIALVTVLGVRIGTAIVVAEGDSERHVGVFEQVELSVMAGVFEVGAVAERVVVALDLGEVLTGEGVGEVVEELEGGGGSWAQLRDSLFEVLGADGAGAFDGGGGQSVVGNTVDEPGQPAGALEQCLDGGRLEQGVSHPARRRRWVR